MHKLKEVDVTDRVLATTLSQSKLNNAESDAGSLEQICAENPGRIPKINHYAKRAYELLPTAVAGLFLAPIACIIGITAIKIEDGYMALSGKDKFSRILASPFHVNDIVMPDGSSRSQWKIRTMVLGAHSQYQQMVEQGIVKPGEYKPVGAYSDPRVTPVGRFLREHSFDEAPQVFQLLGEYFKGWFPSEKNIYLFGNRPQIRESIMNVPLEYRQKLNEGPCGLVGLDCVGRGGSDHKNEISNNSRYSNEYRNHFILPTDLRIAKGLIKAILNGSNA